MLMNEFMNEIESAYHKYFTDSKCIVNFSNSLYSNISINCFVANNKNELSHGYFDNDMFNIKFSVSTDKGQFSKDITEASELPENLKVECYSKGYSTKPTEKYLCYSHKTISFRKTTGDSKKIIITLDKFFKKLHDELIQDIKNDIIHDNYIQLLKSKIIC